MVNNKKEIIINNKKILVTGAAGFIGYHLTQKLIANGFEVIGIDNMNNYYDVKLKYAKLPILGIKENNIKDNLVYQSSKYSNFKFAKIDITDRETLENLFNTEKFEVVCNLAAQAGVQFSIENPHTYIENNITGFINIIDAARNNDIQHFIYASSSSIYGDRQDVPFKETDIVDNPISLYAATKKTNELIAHSYSHLYNFRTTGLRFFTVYGPWGRPDMAPFIFVDKILKGESIKVFNGGNLERDFTYIDDIVDGLSKIINNNNFNIKYNIYNIGNSNPINLNQFIHTIEELLSKDAKIKYLPLRDGDVIRTYADTSKLKKDFDYVSKVNIKEGLIRLIEWYRNVYKNL